MFVYHLKRKRLPGKVVEWIFLLFVCLFRCQKSPKMIPIEKCSITERKQFHSPDVATRFKYIIYLYSLPLSQESVRLEQKSSHFEPKKTNFVMIILKLIVSQCRHYLRFIKCFDCFERPERVDEMEESPRAPLGDAVNPELTCGNVRLHPLLF